MNAIKRIERAAALTTWLFFFLFCQVVCLKYYFTIYANTLESHSRSHSNIIFLSLSSKRNRFTTVVYRRLNHFARSFSFAGFLISPVTRFHPSFFLSVSVYSINSSHCLVDSEYPFNGAQKREKCVDHRSRDRICRCGNGCVSVTSVLSVPLPPRSVNILRGHWFLPPSPPPPLRRTERLETSAPRLWSR